MSIRSVVGPPLAVEGVYNLLIWMSVRADVTADRQLRSVGAVVQPGRASRVVKRPVDGPVVGHFEDLRRARYVGSDLLPDVPLGVAGEQERDVAVGNREDDGVVVLVAAYVAAEGRKMMPEPPAMRSGI